MIQTLVALDLETTGLEPTRDAIIEIGAVKFKGERLEGEFSTLINPGRDIPAFVTQLTGISNAMVTNAPRLSQMLPKLEDFVGDAPIIGHNVRFDLGFLQAKNTLKYNASLDTYDLGSALLPTAGRYNLGALGQELGITLPATHRALDDCRVTVAVYRELFKRALGLPLDLIAEISQLGLNVEWGGDLFFQEVLRARSKEKVAGPRRVRGVAVGPLFPDGDKDTRPLQRLTPPQPLNVDEVAAVLEPGGPFAKHFPQYEYRSEQVHMLRDVGRAFSEGRHLMVEAGTGTGKCLTGEAWITFKSGRRLQIGDICQADDLPTEPILSILPTGKIIYQMIKAVYANGVRPVWQVRTALGRTITATSNHPFLTVGGWNQLAALKIGDRIATLRQIPAGAHSFPDYEAFVAGAMLGDGGCVHQDSLNFTNYDPAVVNQMREMVAKLGNVQMVPNKAHGRYGFRRLSLMGHARSGLSLLLERLQVLGHRAHTKRVPAPYFQADKDTLSHLLAGLWVTDGSLERRDGHPSISFASKQLIGDVQHLLLKLGCVSRVRYKTVKLNGKRFNSWSLIISDSLSKRAFRETVGKYLVGEKKRRLEAWWAKYHSQRFNPNDDLLPVSTWFLIDAARRTAGQSWYALRQHSIISSDRTREISRAKMEVIGEFLASPELTDLANSDLYWDRIVAIEAAGEAPTFDLTMEGEPNFVANDIVVHNSVAYLIPAAQWALQNGERVIISTNTLNLQDQLIYKDVPDVQQALDLPFRATVLKGRSNYLCPRRLDNMRRHSPKTAEEMRVVTKILIWLHEAEQDPAQHGGQLAEISLSGPGERAAWLRLSAEDEGCTSDQCQSKMNGTCPFYRAHRAAQAAHVVIVNHALLLADIASENRVLPDFRYLVVDEAHHLEAATTDGLSFQIGRADIERQIKDLGGPNAGLLGELISSTHDAIPPEVYVGLEREVERAYEFASGTLTLGRDFFDTVATFLEEVRAGKGMGEYGQELRIVNATRTLSGWAEVEVRWDDLARVVRPLGEVLARLARAIKEDIGEEYEIPERDDLISALNAAARHFLALYENLQGLVVKPDPKMIYWVRAQSESGRISLHAAPLHVGPLVEKYLWHAKESVVMASATLTTAGEFDYLKGRLNAREADELAVGSPFNYETSTLLYLVNDIPEPVDKHGYQKAVERGLIDLCKATRGRALVLFTSYAQLKQTAQAIRDPLARAGVEVYDQADGRSRTMLLDSFKASSGGVLLGTKSFWEGVDVPGEALSALVIVKLPFDVPTDPVIAARSETFESPFNDYTLPEAILKFRQGFGRLIRSKSDRGVVAVFDRRILTKQYGKQFIDSLPPCTRRVAPMAQLAKEAAKWIDGGG